MSEDSADLARFTELPNEELVAMVQGTASSQRDKEDAAAAIFQRLYPRLVRDCVRLLGDADLGEDTALYALEKALTTEVQRFENRGPGSFRKWVSRIAHNLALNQLRNTGHLVALDPPLSADPDAVVRHPLDAVALKLDLLEALAEKGFEFQRHLVEARLTEPERMAIILRYRDDLPAREIAKRMGASVRRVHYLLSKAEGKIKETFRGDDLY